MFILQKLRRQSVRRDVRTHCEVVAEDGFRLIGTETLDVSDDGLLVQSEALADVGETVFVSLRIPGGQTWIDAEGSLVRFIRGLRDGDQGRGWGVRFDRIDPVDQGILRGSLVGKPPPLPQRLVKRDYASTIAELWRERLSRRTPPSPDPQLARVAAAGGVLGSRDGPGGAARRVRGAGPARRGGDPS